MLDLHAKIRLTVAGVLLFAVAWFAPELLLQERPVAHERAVGWLPPPAPPVAEEEDLSCPPDTATAEQCAALHRKAAPAPSDIAQNNTQNQNAVQYAVQSASSSSARSAATPLASTVPAGAPAAPAVTAPAGPPVPGNPGAGAVPKTQDKSGVPLSPVPSHPVTASLAAANKASPATASPVTATASAASATPGAKPAPALAEAAAPGAVKGAKPGPPPQSVAASAAPADEGESLRTSPEGAGAENALPGKPERSWSVQVGSYGSKVSAQRMVGELVAQGVPAYVSPNRISRHKMVFRVRAPAADRDSALELALHLREAGYDVSLARPQTGASR